jgi:ketosteroid isomerase-like protein
MSLTPSEAFLQVVHGVSDRRFDELHELYAERTDVRHPLAPGGMPALTTRDEVRDHFARAAAWTPTVRFQPGNVTIHETADPEVIVAEFEYQGTVTATGEPFAIPCVFVWRVRDGQIVEARDYIDHVTFAHFRGQLPQVITRLQGGVPAGG